MSEIRCAACGDVYEVGLIEDGVCCFCKEREEYAALARECGLTRYPDPSGERYVYYLDGKNAGKKSENTDFIDELWDALRRLRGARTGE